jgi:hypothetical protein
MRSARTVEYVRGFIRRLEPFSGERLVQDFVETTRQRLPPAGG